LTDTGSTDARSYPGRELEAMDFAENYHAWILEEIRPYLGRNVAEVGAGIGSISKLLLGESIDRLTAFEPSPDLFVSLEKQAATDPRATAVNDYFSSRHSAAPFDSVVYLNVMEHIENDVEEMQNAFTGLKSGGHLLVFVPALQGLYSDFDKRIGHFRRYSRNVLETRANKAGFTHPRIRYFDVAGIIPWYVNFVMLRNTMQSGAVAVYDRVVVPVMKVVEKIVTPPIGKNLLMIARKP
jgi:phospholipid N-methyltransferase